MPRSGNGKAIPIRTSLQALGHSRPEILAVYLFGSKATGKAGPLSDFDIAILADEVRVKPHRFFQLQMDLFGEVMRACRRSEVDLVLLNQAAPSLAYEAVREGQLLYERDHNARVAFEARTIQRYLDLEPFYRVSRSYLKRQLLRRQRHG